MTRTAIGLAALALGLASMLAALPAHAQPARVFVSGSGNDSNPCTVAAPCRSFQQAFNSVAAGGEIDVLDTAGYGPLDITHAVSIQGHGMGSISGPNNANAITVNAGYSDTILLNGLLLDGSGNGLDGVDVITAGSVQILDCVIRHFAAYGIDFEPAYATLFAVSNTITSDNGIVGIVIEPQPGGDNSSISLDKITATGNGITFGNGFPLFTGLGLYIAIAAVMVSESNLSNNGNGVFIAGGALMAKNNVMSNNSAGFGLATTDSIVWLTKNAISGNSVGVSITGGTANSYGDNDISGNISTDVSGTLTPVMTQ